MGKSFVTKHGTLTGKDYKNCLRVLRHVRGVFEADKDCARAIDASMDIIQNLFWNNLSAQYKTEKEKQKERQKRYS